VAEEITATLDRAGFEDLSADSFRIEVTDSFQRKLGDCRPVRGPDGESDTAHYQIRIARRLFKDDRDTDWQDTVRHEVAHAYVLSEFGQDAKPHGEWKDAARRAGADPTARYEGDDPWTRTTSSRVQRAVSSAGILKRSADQVPWQYACGECETRLVSYDAADVPSELEPGTCYVASIPWEREADREQSDTLRTAPYLLACPNGCTEWPYQQRSKRIKNPWLYTCPVRHDARQLRRTRHPVGIRPGHLQRREHPLDRTEDRPRLPQQLFQRRLRPAPRRDSASRRVQMWRVRRANRLVSSRPATGRSDAWHELHRLIPTDR